MYVCIYIYIYRDRDRDKQTERDKDRETERDTERERERESFMKKLSSLENRIYIKKPFGIVIETVFVGCTFVKL